MIKLPIITVALVALVACGGGTDTAKPEVVAKKFALAALDGDIKACSYVSDEGKDECIMAVPLVDAYLTDEEKDGARQALDSEDPHVEIDENTAIVRYGDGDPITLVRDGETWKVNLEEGDSTTDE